MRLITAILVLSVSAISLCQLPRQTDLWRAEISGGATVPKLGGGTVSGYTFQVARRGDGALPRLGIDLLGGEGGSTKLYRRVTTTSYASVCELIGLSDRGKDSSGVILLPGDYLLEVATLGGAFATAPGAPIMVGTWADNVAQARHFALVPAVGSFDTVALLYGGTASGFKFVVSARPDGSLPYVNQITHEYLISNQLEIYKKTGSSYEVFCYTRMENRGIWPGIPLTPGEYLVQMGALSNPNIYRYANLFTGYWIAP